jgi:hypothetical protein
VAKVDLAAAKAELGRGARESDHPQSRPDQPTASRVLVQNMRDVGFTVE